MTLYYVILYHIVLYYILYYILLCYLASLSLSNTFCNTDLHFNVIEHKYLNESFLITVNIISFIVIISCLCYVLDYLSLRFCCDSIHMTT